MKEREHFKKFSACFLIGLVVVFFSSAVASQTIIADGITNCAEMDRSSWQTVELSAGTHTFTLTDSDFSFWAEGVGSVIPFVMVYGCASDDNRVFTLNGIGDSRSVTFGGTCTVSLGFFDNPGGIQDNRGSSTVSVASQTIIVDGVTNCAEMDRTNIWQTVELSAGTYTFTLTGSDFSFWAEGVGSVIPFVMVYGCTGDKNRVFTLNGTGDSRSVTFDSTCIVSLGFFDNPGAVDNNRGSSTVLIESINDTTTTTAESTTTTTAESTTTTAESTTTTTVESTTTTAGVTTTVAAAICPSDAYPIDCGNGFCCPLDVPVCGFGSFEGFCFTEGTETTTTIPTVTTSLGECTYGSCVSTSECTDALGSGWICQSDCCEQAPSVTTTTPTCTLSFALEGDEEQLEAIRAFRDNVMSRTPEGQEIIRLYYEWSPVLVKLMDEDADFRDDVKEMVDGVLELIGGDME